MSGPRDRASVSAEDVARIERERSLLAIYREQIRAMKFDYDVERAAHTDNCARLKKARKWNGRLLVLAGVVFWIGFALARWLP